jgi:hypothetical protein
MSRLTFHEFVTITTAICTTTAIAAVPILAECRVSPACQRVGDAVKTVSTMSDGIAGVISTASPGTLVVPGGPMIVGGPGVVTRVTAQDFGVRVQPTS